MLSLIMIIIFLVVAFPIVKAKLMKNEYTISREIIINKPKNQVFDYLKMLKNMAYYNKWVMADPNAKMEYKGADGTVGFVSTWDSELKRVGKGEEEIKSITDGERIDFEIRFLKPYEGTSSASITTTSVSGNQTKVVWEFGGTMNYSMKMMHVVLNLKKALGKDIQTSLLNVKSILEQ